mgnify:CR=1 FL=1
MQADPLHCTHLCHGWTSWVHALHPVTPCPFVSQSPLRLTCWGPKQHSPVGFIAADGSALAWLQAVCKLTAVLWQCWQSRSVVWVVVVNTPGCWVQLINCHHSMLLPHLCTSFAFCVGWMWGAGSTGARIAVTLCRGVGAGRVLLHSSPACSSGIAAGCIGTAEFVWCVLHRLR